MQRLPLLVTTVAALAGAASAQVRFVELATIDVGSTSNAANPEFIGSNPSAVAWDGTDLWLGGYNNSVPGNSAGLVKVSDALTAPTLGTGFNLISSPNGRGYSGLDVENGRLAAAYDEGMSNPLGYTLWDTATGALLWSRAGRGSCGVGFDPGFPGGNPALGVGVGYTAFGSGRRGLYDTASGNDVYTLSNGMVFSIMGVATLWRDMEFDEATGSIYLRTANHVVAAQRTGDNALAAAAQIFVSPVPADFVNGQNLAFMDRVGQDYLIFNDRQSGMGGQDFFAVVRVVLPDGTPVSVDWGSFAPQTGSGYYDFSWDTASGTLAVLDFSNRNVHIFRLDAQLGASYCAANANSTGVPAVMGADGSDVLADNMLTLTAQALPQSSFAFFLTSRSQGFVQNPGGSAGNLCITGAIGRYVGPGQIQNSGAAGAVSLPIDLTAMPQPTGPVAAMVGETWNFQCWFRDLVGGLPTSNFTDGLELTFR